MSQDGHPDFAKFVVSILETTILSKLVSWPAITPEAPPTPPYNGQLLQTQLVH